MEYVDGKENGNKIVLPEADRDDVKKAFIAYEAYIGLNDRLNADKTGLVAERNSTAALSARNVMTTERLFSRNCRRIYGRLR